MKALMTTVWNDKDPIIRGFEIIKPDFLILIVDKETKEEQKEALKEIKKYIKELDRDIRLEVEKFNVYDILDIAKQTSEIIKKYSSYEFNVDITASSKPQSLGITLGAMPNERVKKIIITNRDEKVIELPKLKVYFSDNEETILKVLNKYEGKKVNVEKIADETGFKVPTIYKIQVIREYLQEFKTKGYILETEDKTIQLTTTGKFVML